MTIETIKINNEEVAIDALPETVQKTVKRLAGLRNDINEGIESLNELQVLYNYYNELLKNQTTEFLKTSTYSETSTTNDNS